MAASQLELPQLDNKMPLYKQESADKRIGKRLEGIGAESGVEKEDEISKQDVTKSSSKSTSATNGTSYGGKKFKGVKVCCGDLRQYLHSMETYRQASMLRKGREVHKVYVDVKKGSSFLEDRFALTEFGRVVLQDGCVRAGRARNVRHIVVARETLYCSGTGGCRRACGGYGICVPGCDKVKVRGHKCSFRVKLTMRLGFVDHWFVEIMGSHNCYIVSEREAGGRGSTGLDASPPPSDMEKMLADYEMKSSDGEDSDLAGGLSQGPPSAGGSPLTVDSVAAAAQAGVLNLLQSGGLDTGKFLPAAPTPPSSTDMSPVSSAHLMNLPPPSLAPSSFPMLLSPAHCSINVPLFSDSYLEAMARNAAAAVAMSECGVIPPSPASASPLSSPLKKDGRVVSPSPALPNGLGLVGADAGGSYAGGFLPPPPIILPRFGFLPPLPIAADSKQNLHIPMDEKVMDLSTPKRSKGVDSALDSSLPQDLSAKKTKKINGHSGSLKRTLSPANSLSQDLAKRVRQLEAHVTQLRNLVIKADGSKTEGQGRRKPQREFDFNKYNTRHVALKIAYIGWDYQGFVVQEDTDKTVEAALFDALLRTKLIMSRPDRDLGYSMCELTVIGQAFLWHQIRCIVAVLLLIGQGKEDAEVIDHLLNVEENPRKPQYTMASELPLNLFDCEYDEDLDWVYDADCHEENIRHFQQMWAQHTVRATMLKRMLDQLDIAKVETGMVYLVSI
ncbi:tRNA pseudouridine synthase [Elysia marginata]|uniref:tRNA pseudouridine synthase n=1 Tax=Elysia marginata TaxID=1093978 RepID=A0AAV4HK01_9GAST|nr:tRNA pseudouridine synthase [Elysia marginata]